MLEVILGRAGSGKTKWLMEQIVTELKRDPLGPPIWLIVPDHVTFAAEARLAQMAPGGVLLRGQVVSMRRLARQVLSAAGVGVNVPLREAGKFALLTTLYEQRRQDWQVLRQEAAKPHVIERLMAFVEECQRQQVSVADMRKVADRLTEQPELQAKTRDLALLLEAYRQRTEGKWFDAMDLLPALVKQLPNAPLISGAQVYLDGFVSFSPQEWQLIGGLIQHAASVGVSICAPSAWVDDSVRQAAAAKPLSHPFAEAADMLARIEQLVGSLQNVQWRFQATSDNQCARFEQAPVLAALERGLYTVGEESTNNARGLVESDQPLVLATATTRRAEVRGTLSALLTHKKAGVRWSDMIIVVPDLPTYADLLHDECTTMGIPFYMDKRLTIARHPLTVFLLAALQTADLPNDMDALFALLKSDLAPLSRGVVDALENDAFRGAWRPALHPAHSHAEQAQSDDHPRSLSKRHKQVEALLQGLLQPFWQQVQAGASVRTVATALWSLLMQVGAQRKLTRFADADLRAGRLLEAKLHARALTGTAEALDELVEVFADEVLPLPLLREVLRRSLEAIALGAIPAALEQVVITEAVRIRSVDAAVVFVLGCIDGAFPARMREDDLLADAERITLAGMGVEFAAPAAQRQLYERYRVYIALTRARNSLTLSFPLVDERGRSLTPSFLLSHIRSILPPQAIKEVVYRDELSGDPDLDRALYSTPAQAAFWLTSALVEARRTGQLAPHWRLLYDSFSQDQLPRTYALRALAGFAHTVHSEALPPALAEALYGSELAGSVSRLERFSACAFAHFAQYGLRLRARERLQVDAAQRGTLAHESLRRFSEVIATMDQDWGELTDETVLACMDTAFEQSLTNLTAASFLQSARAEHEARQVQLALRRAALVLTEHARRSEFRPVFAELGFGRDHDPLPALTLELTGGRRLRLRGQIDRVDLVQQGRKRWYRIVDYKSGEKRLQLDRVYHGLTLQLPLYARVLEQIGEKLLGGEPNWAGVFYFPVRDVITRVASPTPAEQTVVELRKRLRLRGLLRRDTEVVDWSDRLARQGATDLWPKLLKKDGLFDSRALTASSEQWQALGQWTEDTARTLAEQIYAGVTAVEPYQLHLETACDLCACQAVCGFEPATGGGRYRQLDSIETREVWSLMGACEQEESP